MYSRRTGACIAEGLRACKTEGLGACIAEGLRACITEGLRACKAEGLGVVKTKDWEFVKPKDKGFVKPSLLREGAERSEAEGFFPQRLRRGNKKTLILFPRFRNRLCVTLSPYGCWSCRVRMCYTVFM